MPEMRRIGSTPQQRGSMTGQTCPDVIELDARSYLVIGKRTEADWPRLADVGASVGEDEQAVIVPRNCLLTAARQLVAEDAGDADARSAYEAYGATFSRPVRMASWEELTNKIRAAWVNAAIGIRNRALIEAADKIRKEAEEWDGWPAKQATMQDTAALIDPRDPRSLDD